jgi:alpha-beta hydrolase superfamily lysophospholipase
MKTLPFQWHLFLLFAAVTLLGCRSVPSPDPTAEYRHLLTEEIGPIGFDGIGAEFTLPAGSRPEGPQVKKYRETFGYDLLLSRTGAYHRMGMLNVEKLDLGVQYFIPAPGAGRRKGTVFFAHGYLDHTGLLMPLIGPLVEAGFAVAAVDLPGHGFSEGERGAVLDFSDYGAAAAGLVGLFWMSETAKGAEEYFPRPWTAVGHSTGAAAFYIYLLEKATRGLPSPFDTVVFINPLVRSAMWQPSMIGLFLFGWAKRNYEPMHSPDPLLGIHNFPVSWAEELRDWNKRIQDLPPLHHRGLILQGLKDKVVDYRFNIPFLQRKIEGIDILYLDNLDHVPYTPLPENRRIMEELLKFLDR